MRKLLSIKYIIGLSVFASSAFLSLLTYYYVHSSTQKNLQIEFDALLVNYTLDIKKIFLEKHGLDLLNYESDDALEDKIFPFPHGQSLIQILDDENSIVAKSLKLGDNELPYDDTENKIHMHPLLTSAQLLDSQGRKKDYRVALLSIADESGVSKGYLQVAVPTDFIEQQETRLDAELLKVLPLIIIFIVALSWLFSNAITLPISLLVKQIQKSEIKNLGEEFEVPKWPYEINKLAVEFLKLLKLIKSNQTKQEEFFLNAAHQLKTPLFILRNDFLENPHFEKTFKDKTVGRINDLSHVLQNLIDFGRAASELHENQKADFQIIDLITDVILRLSPLAEAKNIKLQLHADLSRYNFYGEATLIEQAIQNLVDNAIYWSPRDQEIKINVSSTKKENRIGFKVQVIDSGPGVSESVAKKMFLPFACEPAKGHSGLGLALVKRVAELHHGQVSYQRLKAIESVFEMTVLSSKDHEKSF